MKNLTSLMLLGAISGCTTTTDNEDFDTVLEFTPLIKQVSKSQETKFTTSVFKSETDDDLTILISNPLSSSISVNKVSLYGATGNDCYITSTATLTVPSQSKVLIGSLDIESIEGCLTKDPLSSAAPTAIIANGTSTAPSIPNSSSESRGFALSIVYTSGVNSGELVSSESLHYIWSIE